MCQDLCALSDDDDNGGVVLRLEMSMTTYFLPLRCPEKFFPAETRGVLKKHSLPHSQTAWAEVTRMLLLLKIRVVGAALRVTNTVLVCRCSQLCCRGGGCWR